MPGPRGTTTAGGRNCGHTTPTSWQPAAVAAVEFAAETPTRG